MSIEKNASFIRWQGRTVEQLGFVNNLLIALATALLIFEGKLPFDEKKILTCADKCLIVFSILLIFFSLSVGCYVAWNRLHSFRQTTQIARQRETGKTTDINELRVLVRKLDNRTWHLLTIQTILFFLGLLLFVFSSIFKYLN